MRAGGRETTESERTATANPGRRELGRDGGTERVVTTDTDAHDEAPHDEDANDVDRRTVTGDSLADRGNNHCARTAGPGQLTPCWRYTQEQATAAARGRRSKGQEEGRTDHELDAVHLFAANDICEPAEQELPHKCATGCRDLEPEVLVGSERTAVVVHEADHACGQVDGKDVVAERGGRVRRV